METISRLISFVGSAVIVALSVYAIVAATHHEGPRMTHEQKMSF